MIKGKVVWFNDVRGFGFLAPVDGSPDVFVHFSAIRAEDEFRSLEQGEEVEFEVITDINGRPKAANVRKLAP